MLSFIDCHAHLTDTALISKIQEVRNNYLSNNVKIVVDTGCSLKSSLLASENAKKFEEVYFTAGIHPENSNDFLNEELLEIEKLLTLNKCIAVGEIGFDYHYEGYQSNLQKNLFYSQIELANKYNLPIVVHSRDACLDTLNALKENSSKLKNGFLMHCYSESYEVSKEILNLGGYFSFGGAITFKNSKRGEVLAKIPMDRILVETDSPYLTPVPKRGELNEPKNIVYTYQKIAEIYGVSIEKVVDVVSENFKKLYKVDF